MASSEFHTALFGLRSLLSNVAVTETADVTAALPGTALTSEGPAPYQGNILDDPELLWTDDVWRDEDTTDAEERVMAQGAPLPAFWRGKYTAKAAAHWHSFYKRNADHFYKDRHYLHLVYPELLNGPSAESNDGYFHLLEVGCGVGNAVLPLLELNPHIKVHAVDFARSAVEILRMHPLVKASGRLQAHVFDVVADCVTSIVTLGSVDAVLCMFVLSAIAPEAQGAVLAKLASTLHRGGTIFVRDYGRHDEAQLRFKKGAKLSDNFYVRQDGTCAYYFVLEELLALAEGLRDEDGNPLLLRAETECFYIHRQYANRGQHKARRRVWIQAKLVRL